MFIIESKIIKYKNKSILQEKTDKKIQYLYIIRGKQ